MTDNQERAAFEAWGAENLDPNVSELKTVFVYEAFVAGWQAARAKQQNNPASLSPNLDNHEPRVRLTDEGDAQTASMSLHAAPMDASDGGGKQPSDDMTVKDIIDALPDTWQCEPSMEASDIVDKILLSAMKGE